MFRCPCSSWMVFAAVLTASPALGQKEQFIPVLTYRTGAYAVSGIPYANGEVDYYRLINERDGGVNSVRLLVEECETGYATDRGLECYERLKGKGPTGAAFVVPRSTGVTLAIGDKPTPDKIPILTPGHGRAASKNGAVFAWSFPVLGTYWSGSEIALQHIAKELGGASALRGKRIVLLFHDSPYGREPIPALLALRDKYGFSFRSIPVPHPGLEQQSQWQTIRQESADYVLLWGWGAMNSATIKHAAEIGYPRERIIGVWWSGNEADVRPVSKEAIGYKALMLQHGSGKFPVHADIERHVYAKGRGAGPVEQIGEVLYNRGLIGAVIGIEAIRKAQQHFGMRPLTGEEVRWGLERLDISEARLKELGIGDMIKPLKVTCADHEGSRSARIQQWDGTAWRIISDWYTADETIVEPIVQEVSARYSAQRNITPRDCSQEK